jgi:hypothetical protein
VELVERVVNVCVIESRIRSGFIGHDYFHSDPTASSDLVLVIHDLRRPGPQHGRPLGPADVNLRLLREGYPIPSAGERLYVKAMTGLSQQTDAR